jgi:hypothetical protein
MVYEEYLTEAVFTIKTVGDDTAYYWRVKSHNDAGDSDWSAAQMFYTTAPFITVRVPNSGGEFQRGLDYFLHWDDNIEEDVVLQISEEGTDSWMIIDTTESRSAYKWSIDPQITLGNYFLRIQSITDSLLYDTSDESFLFLIPRHPSVHLTMKRLRAFTYPRTSPIHLIRSQRYNTGLILQEQLSCPSITC